MNLQWLASLEEENQFDEVCIINRTLEIQEQLFYFIALTRKGDDVKLGVLAQTEPEEWMETRKHRTMRDTLKENMARADTCGWDGLKRITADDAVLEFSGATACSMGVNQDVCVYLIKLMEAGWQIPKESPFFEIDFNHMQLIQYELRNPVPKLPDCAHVHMTVTWDQRIRQHLLQKRVRLTVENEAQGIRSDKKIAFTIADTDQGARSGICYINHVKLTDPWKEMKELFALPEYRSQALAHMTEEEFEQTKESVVQALEQQFPRGTRYINVEYECTLDMSLDFYSSDYLRSKPSAHTGSATFLIINSKPDKELGKHGLRLRSTVLNDPVLPETEQVQAELFYAHEQLPEREVELHEQLPELKVEL